MLSLDRILIPTDGSETAQRALPYAAHLADRHDAALHVLHLSFADGAQDPEETPTSRRELIACARRAAEGLGVSEKTHHPTLVRARRDTESVQSSIAEYAEAEDVDLVVMGTTDADAPDTRFSQSRVAGVVRHAPCPVFTIPSGPDPTPTPVDRIFVPYDFSSHANGAVEHAEALASLYEAEITLVHVIEELMVPAEYEVQVPDLNVRSVRSRARAALHGVANEDHQVLVAHGHPAQRIVEIATEKNADLVVLATHGRTGLRRMLLGSVAEQVLRQAHCPVFTVKAFDGDAAGSE